MSLPLPPRQPKYSTGTLRDGTPVLLRDLCPEDGPAVSQALSELSPVSRYQRFLGPVDRLSRDQVEYLTQPDGVNHLALGMALCTADGGEGSPIAIARCIRSRQQPDRAEVAVVVADAWQRRGVGSLLFERLHAEAWEVGIRFWEATMLAENRGVLRLLGLVGVQRSCGFEGPGVMEVVYELRQPG